jgi:hypothetical protein
VQVERKEGGRRTGAVKVEGGKGALNKTLRDLEMLKSQTDDADAYAGREKTFYTEPRGMGIATRRK